ncbi:TonB-dependent receptor plug domain-containing protein [Flavobacterium sp. KACC 22761]|uniref:TonB-dependent receptor plug domain-containing protein n=1 Tax=Flavobacterium sp. KACC 22761 TaxID=3092665 RepID=UPI002A75661C|nr:TonB-dependent receptor plug domain-containing protein [Flavobacterium sp. KACC 22761]WPO79136.1 TonB-dependent receptor plug domain-containing protein [Flavobacterium sp. KACC 22761]
MKSLKLISSVLLMLFCFIAIAQEKTISKDTIQRNNTANTQVVICGPSRSKVLEPLYILDGRVSNSKQLSKINPNDIETIKVLKGEEAKSIYGDKGVNGVIVITLKK